MTGSGWLATGGTEGRYPPLLAVLPHAHAAPVPRGGVAAGPLPHLEADATRGAAGGPRGPGGPASVPGGRSNRVTAANLREAQPPPAPAPASHGGSPTGTTDRGLPRPWEQGALGINEMYCLGTTVTRKSVPAPPNLIFESKEKT